MCLRLFRGEMRNASSLLNTMRQREMDLCIVELLHRWSTAFRWCNFLNLDNLNAIASCSMSTSHITIALGNRCGCSQIAIFTIHVVRRSSRIVSQPNAEIFHSKWSFLINSSNGNDFSVCLFQFLQRTYEIPKSRFCNDGVRCEYFHLIQWWI